MRWLYSVPISTIQTTSQLAKGHAKRRGEYITGVVRNPAASAGSSAAQAAILPHQGAFCQHEREDGRLSSPRSTHGILLDLKETAKKLLTAASQPAGAGLRSSTIGS
ncbi:hypothetical protein [Shinella kummerowiae]|uniref:hypothetical protein n=1 Tax=Shinella kummerowiae TaxID=417745 RepID=UPI0021B67FB5|nr:hypothetical protein [Shinella kummerowiae]MCT7662686.1 hypothetical protein [Shinella kummerowiae]